MAQNASNNSSGGIGFVGLLTIVFVTLKLVGKIDWSWWWVLSPIWTSTGLVIGILLIFGAIALSSGGSSYQRRVGRLRCAFGQHGWREEGRTGYFGPSLEEIRYRVRKCDHCGRVEDLDEPGHWYESPNEKLSDSRDGGVSKKLSTNLFPQRLTARKPSKYGHTQKVRVVK